MEQKICIASDSLLIGESLCRQLEDNTQFSTNINLFFYERELMSFIKNNKQAMVIIFSRMKDVTANDLLEKIKSVSRFIKVILIDNNVERLKFLISTKRDICKGVLFHDIGMGELFHCLREVLDSRDYVSSQLRFGSENIMYKSFIEGVGGLSSREKEIFELIGQGNSTQQICVILCISPATINNHKTNLCNKLHIGRKELYTTAVQYKHYLNTILN